jgi:ABC-2 type transport system ATP-binding protein
MEGPMVELKELSKQYGACSAVNRLSLQVPPGTLFGLLGPNGAGKSTTLKMLMGICRPTSGQAKVLGMDAQTDSLVIRRRVGFIPEDKTLYSSMRVRDFLKVYGSFYPDWNATKASELLDHWRIKLEQRIGTLSKGTRAKLMLIAVLSRNPELLLADEPTDGADVETVEEILPLLLRWVSNGDRSVVLCTHRLDEVERICDRIVLINLGQTVLEGDLDEIRTAYKLIQASGNLPVTEIRQWPEVAEATMEGSFARIRTCSRPEQVMERLRAYSPLQLEIFDMNLREIYLCAVARQKGTSHGRMETLV